MKISITSKLDGIKSWSLQALETCPGSIGENAQLVAACSGCYATTGNYRFPNVKAPRAHNKEDWKRDSWVNDMVQALQNERFFRWFDSGDMYALELADKVYQVMQLTPWCNHWLPTRMHKFDKFKPVLNRMKSLHNASVRFSSDSVNGEFIKGLHGSTITATNAPEDTPEGVTLCEAYRHGGKCSGCRKCWDKGIEVIGYPAHGVKLKKIIRIAKG